MSEAAWKRIPPLPLVVFAPRYGAAPSQRTEIRLAHDAKYLYASARCFDTEPTQIRATSLVRDDEGNDDFFNLVIDTFDDHENAVWFLVTPLGNRVDGSITDDAEGSAWNHHEYNTFWEAVASRGDWGWSAEMRIPLKSLRFNRDSTGAVTMGIIAGRYISRNAERQVFPAIRPGPANAQYKPSLAAPMRLEGLDATMPLYLQLYGLVGAERATPALPTDPQSTGQLVHELGGDAKIGLASDLTLDLTLNPDFAQTEIDAAQVNLTRYSLLLPEKRAFFLERAGTFSLDAGEDTHLFYSRRIGLDTAGTPERILGGARVVGRVGRWDFGTLDLQVDGSDSVPAENDGVVRVRRSLGHSNSYVGGILTSSSGTSRPLTAGIDAVLNVEGDDYVSFEAGVTPPEGRETSRDDALWRLFVERRNQQGWAYRGELAHVGINFEPALGFVRRPGLTTGAAEVSYGSFGEGVFQDSRWSLEAAVARRDLDHGTESAQVALAWVGDRDGGGYGQVDLTWRHEGLLEPLRFGNASAPAGAYDFVDGALTLATPDGLSFGSTLGVSGGWFYDGYRLTASLSPRWTPCRYVSFSGDFEADRIWFPARDELFTAYVSRLLVGLSLNTHLSTEILAQRNSADGGTTGFFRFRYMIRDGSNVYVVLSARRWDGPPGSPRTLRTQTNAEAKYTITVQ